MRLTNTWETFLPIDLSSTSDEAPPLDESWLVQRGIDPASPAVLRHLRDDIAPLVFGLESEGLGWYSFLVHGVNSGVPTTPDDRGAYIHLRLGFESASTIDFESYMRDRWPEFRWVRRWEVSKEIAGVDAEHMDIGDAWSMIGDQSAWLLNFICQHHTGDLAALVKHTRQFLHFFANATQMRVA